MIDETEIRIGNKIMRIDPECGEEIITIDEADFIEIWGHRHTHHGIRLTHEILQKYGFEKASHANGWDGPDAFNLFFNKKGEWLPCYGENIAGSHPIKYLHSLQSKSKKNTHLMTPLPSWITDKGNGRYLVDIEAAKVAGEPIPIQLGKIPQFAEFFTNPPTRRGIIEFVQHVENKPIDPFIEWLDKEIERYNKLRYLSEDEVSPVPISGQRIVAT